jgi:cyclic beta-1,2-glucan synthetase
LISVLRRRASDRSEETLAGPIGGEPLGSEHLAERALEVAREQRLAPPRRKGAGAPLLARLTETRGILDEVHDRLAEYSAADGDVGPAGEWLLDNYHVVQEHIREVHESLPRGYYYELPELADGTLAGFPRVYELAITLISHTEGRIDVDNVDLFVGAFQQVSQLSLGELWAVPAMLRLGSIESVRRMALRTAQRIDEMERADQWAARIAEAASDGSRKLQSALDNFVSSKPNLSSIFVTRLLHQLRPIRGAHRALIRLEKWIAEEAMSPDEAASRSTARLALTQLMMANSITSLRAITHIDWREFVEHQSVTEAVLRQDPATCYAGMTFATRDHYRHAVERIAKRTKKPEPEIARHAVDLARAAHDADPADVRRAHIGYYLIGDGRYNLERATGYRTRVGEAIHRWLLRHPNVVFAGGIALCMFGALAAVFALAGEPARSAWPLVLLLVFLPALDIAVATVNQLVTAFLPPHRLPKLDLDAPNGIPEKFRTAVVVPTLFASVEAAREAIDHLEVQFLANRDRHLHFALLSDFTDASAETLPEDAAILESAVAGIRALNEEYAPETNDVFYLLHRPRRWNAQEGVWMGWERKRGKLGEFNRFIRGETGAFTTVIGDTAVLQKVRYVITLDSDTVLPPGSGRLLVGALAHPLNHAEHDATTGRVVRGYGILQPRVGVSLPSAHRSRFAAIHSGHPGVDPYTTAVSDVYQDLYAEGSFTGKGIYDVDTFELATHGRFPENLLLSHDLIEGSYARAGLVTDISLYDDYPAHYLSYSRRKHRWIRGDWHLMRWLLPVVTGPAGRGRNPLSMLSRWKIFDNLRRSTTEIAQLIFLVAGWLVLPGKPWVWTLLALGAIAAPWILSMLLAIVRPPFDKSWTAYYEAVWHDAIVSAQQVFLTIVFLPHQAWLSLHAIALTLWRMGVTHRHMLEWQTASVAEHHVAGSMRGIVRAMWPALAITAAVLALASVTNVQSVLFGGLLPIGILWLASPAIARALSKPALPAARQLSARERKMTERYAALHWAYFDRFVTAKTNWLAPDNFQDDPAPVIAMRTSPTNIGLQLLATVSAHELGFITREDMTERLERTFATMEKMSRYRGHFYNWYDLTDLGVLEPAYISTVDSGNLAGHLLALRQACLAFDSDLATAARLEQIAARAQRYVQEMDFAFLFDAPRKLFAIGYQQSSHTLDPSYYDLLASEARLASFVAIAKHDVPVDHWFHLDRTLTRSAGATALISWSGSVFEYLMPALVMRSLPFTVLDQTYRAIVQRHIAFGAEREVPWGVSESAYNLRDRHQTYQYRAFGVPDLALKRGLGRDLVIAPYASALAFMVDPARALANLAALEALGAVGEYGFRDALDYTRPMPGQRFAIVHNFMAHHIGMSLIALTNALTDNIWQRWFHAEPLIKGAELLLYERIPRRLVLQETQKSRADEALPDPDIAQPAVREVHGTNTETPHIALLGRLPYTLMLSNAGGGYSRYEGMAVTRWRSDGTTDNTGQFCYVKDVTTGRVWSAGHQPICAPATFYRALLATDRVTFERIDGDIETQTEIAVVPEDSAEVRRVTLTNNSNETREIELTSYGEVVLTRPEADRVHPAFANLFVETEWHDWCSSVMATRRPRSATEKSVWCMHVAATGEQRVGDVTFETDRSKFIGRGRTTRDPAALDADGALSGTAGAVLDPVFALRSRVRLAPGQSASVAFTTLIATTREQAFALADRYQDPRTVQRALDLSWAATQVELRELAITPAEAAVIQDLAGHLLYSSPALRAPQEEMARDRGSQPLLWAQGISGDWPILLATIESAAGLPTLRELFAAHHYLRRRGMTVDLVVVNEHPSGYTQALEGDMLDAMFVSGDANVMDQPGGVYFRRGELLDEATRLMLRASARAHFVCDGRSMAHILESLAAKGALSELTAARTQSVLSLPRRAERDGAPQPRHRRRVGSGQAAPLDAVRSRLVGQPRTARAGEVVEVEGLLYDNGTGGMDADGAYRIRVRGEHLPPAPWLNVIAHEHGGFLASERGSGSMWAGNSYFYRVTPWHNDPVSDPASDAIYLRDAESSDLWTATPAPVWSDLPYGVTHGHGYSTFDHERDGIATSLTMGIAPDAAVKISLLRVTNHDRRARVVGITAYAEWTLGVLREHTQHQVRTSYDAAHSAILAQNTYDPQFADWVAFCAVTEAVSAYTGNRREFVGRNGSMAAPAALAEGAPSLSGITGSAYDPCAALQFEVTLAPGETREYAVLTGAAPTESEALRVIENYRDTDRARSAVAQDTEAWSRRLNVVSVQTPEPSFDAMLNRWMLYQALGCRMWARSALYQSSGAYGFRDQLQDVMAFLYAEPGIARAHIVLAAGRQFVEGDVQHWWHPQSGRGVRTRFSDDLVWLPYVVDGYIAVTGDDAILDEIAPFLTMRTLEPHEHEVYELPQIAQEQATIYEHCRRALDRACTSGPHGLPLIGTGDWNDGMNRVGIEGKGESVWLAWFLTDTLRRFAKIADRRGHEADAQRFRARADAYAGAAHDSGWDGAWYRRAYFDDGTPIGSRSSEECKIDSIAQSWSVISGAGDPARAAQAMQSLEQHLVNDAERLLVLLTPPFDTSTHDPGYIKGYLPGVRENGAQYTHAALWAVLATALSGNGERAFQLYQMINPLEHARTSAEVAKYKVEPYVIAADVYTAEGSVGRGGWTWYTGSASWMYRVGLEAILGFTKRGNVLKIVPRVPAAWPEFKIRYQFGNSTYEITVREPAAVGEFGAVVKVDGRNSNDGEIPLIDDGKRHDVEVSPQAEGALTRG